MQTYLRQCQLYVLAILVTQMQWRCCGISGNRTSLFRNNRSVFDSTCFVHHEIGGVVVGEEYAHLL